MANLGKRLIKSSFRRLGVDIQKLAAPVAPITSIDSSLRAFGIDTVLDVGANTGQFASSIRDGGYAGNIVSFEPLSSAHRTLCEVSREDPRWKIHARCALGAHHGEAEINIAGNSASSSLLPMLESHVSAAPEAAYVGKESGPLLTLDSVADEYVESSMQTFLKIDAQGFEAQVLEGAQNLLPNISGISLELSLVPLYGDQLLWEALIDRLNQEGFTLWAIQPAFSDPLNGRTLQVDGIFFRLPAKHPD